MGTGSVPLTLWHHLGTEESRAHPKLNDDHCHAWAASSGHGMLIGSLLRVCHMGGWCPHHGVQRILKLERRHLSGQLLYSEGGTLGERWLERGGESGGCGSDFPHPLPGGPMATVKRSPCMCPEMPLSSWRPAPSRLWMPSVTAQWVPSSPRSACTLAGWGRP